MGSALPPTGNGSPYTGNDPSCTQERSSPASFSLLSAQVPCELEAHEACTYGDTRERSSSTGWPP